MSSSIETAEIQGGEVQVTIGRSVPLTPGAKPAADSLPVVLATDQPAIPVFDSFDPVTAVAFDQFGFPVSQSRQFLLQDVLNYGINSNVWFTSTSNATITYLPDRSSAELRLAANNGIAIKQTKYAFQYQPGKETDVSIAMQCSLGKANENVLIQWGEFTKRDGYGFRLLSTWNASKGAWENRVFFFRRTSAVTPTTGTGLPRTGVLADYPSGGQVLGDKTMYRPAYLVNTGTDTTLIDLDTWEEIIPITDANRDRLDGSLDGGPPGLDGVRAPAAHHLSLIKDTVGANTTVTSNLVMTLVRRSWYGGSGGSYGFYIPDRNPPTSGSTRWVISHEVRIGDTLPVPSMESPDLPVTMLLCHRRDRLAQNISPDAFFRRYGISVWINGGDPKPRQISSASSGDFRSVPAGSYTPLLAIALKPFVYNRDLIAPLDERPQKSRIYPQNLTIAAIDQPAEVYLLVNPTTLDATPSNWFSGKQSADHLQTVASVSSFTNTYGVLSGRPFSTGGKLYGPFYVGAGQGVDRNLLEIFDPQREQLGRSEQVAAGSRGDTLVVIARSIGSAASQVAAGLIWGQQ